MISRRGVASLTIISCLLIALSANAGMSAKLEIRYEKGVEGTEISGSSPMPYYANYKVIGQHNVVSFKVESREMDVVIDALKAAKSAAELIASFYNGDVATSFSGSQFSQIKAMAGAGVQGADLMTQIEHIFGNDTYDSFGERRFMLPLQQEDSDRIVLHWRIISGDPTDLNWVDSHSILPLPVDHLVETEWRTSRGLEGTGPNHQIKSRTVEGDDGYPVFEIFGPFREPGGVDAGYNIYFYTKRLPKCLLYEDPQCENEGSYGLMLSAKEKDCNLCVSTQLTGHIRLLSRCLLSGKALYPSGACKTCEGFYRVNPATLRCEICPTGQVPDEYTRYMSCEECPNTRVAVQKRDSVMAECMPCPDGRVRSTDGVNCVAEGCRLVEIGVLEEEGSNVVLSGTAYGQCQCSPLWTLEGELVRYRWDCPPCDSSQVRANGVCQSCPPGQEPNEFHYACVKSERQPGTGNQLAISIAGNWTSNIGLNYVIEQQGSSVTWKTQYPPQIGKGTIKGISVTATWQVAGGPLEGPASGRLVFSPDKTYVMRIIWDNGVVFERGIARSLQPRIRD